MSNKINMSVGIPGREGKNNVRRLLTLERLIEWIKSHRLDKQTEDGLIELAASYPTAAFPSFQRNFHVMLNRVRQKSKLENRKITDPQAPLEKAPTQANMEIITTEKKGKVNVQERKVSLREKTRESFRKEEEQRISEISQDDFEPIEEERKLTIEELEAAMQEPADFQGEEQFDN